MKVKKVNISYACPIKWDSMQSIDAKSKFCDSCKIKVQDFTKDTELHTSGIHCGRFRMDQVESIDRTFSFNPRQVFVVSLLSLLGMTTPIAAQTASDFRTAQSIIAKEAIITIRGIMKDSTTNEGVPFANVVIKKADGTIVAGGPTNFDGEVEINVSQKYLLEEGTTIEVSVLGYATKKMEVPIIESNVMTLEVRLGEALGELEKVHVLGGCNIIDDNSSKRFDSEEIRESPYRQ